MTMRKQIGTSKDARNASNANRSLPRTADGTADGTLKYDVTTKAEATQGDASREGARNDSSGHAHDHVQDSSRGEKVIESLLRHIAPPTAPAAQAEPTRLPPCETTVHPASSTAQTARAGQALGDVARAPTVQPLVGVCDAVNHPSLEGRVQVAWVDAQSRERTTWLPCLKTVTCRAGDRVLLSQPANHHEPVVIGVIDGFERRPPPKEHPGPALSLQQDEALTITDHTNQPLFNLRKADDGVVIQLINNDCKLHVQGKLSLRAKELDLKADEGRASITASEDVVLTGEQVRLN
jgi:hypothetical protein